MLEKKRGVGNSGRLSRLVSRGALYTLTEARCTASSCLPFWSSSLRRLGARCYFEIHSVSGHLFGRLPWVLGHCSIYRPYTKAGQDIVGSNLKWVRCSHSSSINSHRLIHHVKFFQRVTQSDWPPRLAGNFIVTSTPSSSTLRLTSSYGTWEWRKFLPCPTTWVDETWFPKQFKLAWFCSNCSWLPGLLARRNDTMISVANSL